MITLHADDSQDPTQKFLLKLSSTTEAPRVIGNNGHPVTDGGISILRKTGQLKPKKTYGHPGSRPAGPAQGPVSSGYSPNYGMTSGSNSNSGYENFAEMEYEEEEELEIVDNRLKNMGLMFAIVAIAVLAICAAVGIRKKIESRNEKAESEKNEEKS